MAADVGGLFALNTAYEVPLQTDLAGGLIPGLQVVFAEQVLAGPVGGRECGHGFGLSHREQRHLVGLASTCQRGGCDSLADVGQSFGNLVHREDIMSDGDGRCGPSGRPLPQLVGHSVAT